MSGGGTIYEYQREVTARLEQALRERDEARAEVAAWRKATGRDDPEALDSYLGRAGIDAHLNVVTALMTKIEAERDEARAEVERLRKVLVWLNQRGGLGLAVHEYIDAALAPHKDTP